MARDFTPETATISFANYAEISDVDLETYSIWAFWGGFTGTSGRLFDDGLQRLLFTDDTLSNKLRFAARRRTAGDWNWPAPSTGVWHCVQLTMDNTSEGNQPELYFDGENLTRTEVTAYAGILDTATPTLHIGNNVASGSRGFDGRLAEAALWNKILTVNELDTVRFRGPPRVSNGLIFYAPIWGLTDPEPNLAPIVGRTHGSLSGTVVVAPHAPVPNPFANRTYIFFGIAPPLACENTIQRGTAQIAGSGTTATITAGSEYTAPSALSKAFIRIVSTRLAGSGNNSGATGNAGAPDHGGVIVSNPDNLLTSIAFIRDTANSEAINIDWEIVEYTGADGGANEFIVRDQGTHAFTTTSDTTAAVSGIVTDDDVAVFITGQRADSSQGATWDRCLSTAQWDAGGDTITFEKGDGTGTATVSYAVVVFTGSNWNVQRFAHTMTGTSPENQAITDVGDTTRAFMHIQVRTSNGNSDEQGVTAEFTSAINVSLDLPPASSATVNVVGWVIDNTDTDPETRMIVEHLSVTQGTGGGEPETFTDTITPVIEPGCSSIFGECGYTNDTGDNPQRGHVGLRITGTTEVTLRRADTAATDILRYSVVQWPRTSGEAPPTLLVRDVLMAMGIIPFLR